MRTLFWHSIITKICTDFTFIRFFKIFWIFFTLYCFIIKSFLILLLTLSQFVSCFLQFNIFYQKRHLFSFIKTFYRSSIFGIIILNVAIIISVTIKYLKYFLSKILVRCHYYINIYIVYVD